MIAMDENMDGKINLNKEYKLEALTSPSNITWKKSSTSTCKFCNKSITKKNLKRHEGQCSKSSVNDEKRFLCKICSRSFTRKDNLKSHFNIHRNGQERTSRLKFLSCTLDDACHQIFTKRISLIEHLKNHHQCKIEDPTIMSFSTVGAFEKWKEEEEERSFSYFSKQNGDKTYGESKHTYFYCQHDTPNSKKEELRKQTSRKQHKPIGRIKSGKRCISMIKLELKANGECNVKYYPTHNHPLSNQDWKFQPQAKSTYQFIDQHIALNVPPAKIVQALKEPMSTQTKLTKAHLISRNLIRQRALRKRTVKRFHEGCDSERHIKGLQIPDSSVTLQGNQGIILSSDTDGSNYIVTKLQDHCFNDFCFFRCTEPSCINLCSHLYICSCPDTNHLCKHIHKIHSINTSWNGNECNIDFFTKSESPVSSKSDLLKKVCLEKIHELSSLIESNTLPPEQLSKIIPNLNDLINQCKTFSEVQLSTFTTTNV